VHPVVVKASIGDSTTLFPAEEVFLGGSGASLIVLKLLVLFEQARDLAQGQDDLYIGLVILRVRNSAKLSQQRYIALA
jgi:hypothetical protein